MLNLNIEKRLSDCEGIQEDQDAVLVELSKKIKELKTDQEEVLNLMRLVGGFFRKPVFGTVEQNPAKEFEKRLQALLEKHGVEK